LDFLLHCRIRRLPSFVSHLVVLSTILSIILLLIAVPSTVSRTPASRLYAALLIRSSPSPPLLRTSCDQGAAASVAAARRVLGGTRAGCLRVAAGY